MQGSPFAADEEGGLVRRLSYSTVGQPTPNAAFSSTCKTDGGINRTRPQREETALVSEAGHGDEGGGTEHLATD